MLKCPIVGFALSLTLSASACTTYEFGTENLLYPAQNTPQINFQELEAFAAGRWPTRPLFTGHDPRFQSNLNAPIDLQGFGYVVVHYAPGTSGDPSLNLGGSLDFYFIKGNDMCNFIFPQTGPGGAFSNGRITSITLFTSETIPEAGETLMLLVIGLVGLAAGQHLAAARRR
jgi:hypothetical protein